MAYDRLMIDLCKAIKTEKSWASENLFEEVINTNAMTTQFLLKSSFVQH